MEKKFKCVLCKKASKGFGNNPFPLARRGRACDACNVDVVHARLKGTGLNITKGELKEVMSIRVKMVGGVPTLVK